MKVDSIFFINSGRWNKVRTPGTVHLTYREGSKIVLWETPVAIDDAGRYYWMDMCGCPYTPDEIWLRITRGELRELKMTLRLPPPA